MLRDFEYHPRASQIINILQRFGFNSLDQEYPFALLRFEIISPDSFMWRLLLDNAVYYLYAQDYIPDLNYVKKVYNAYLESGEWDLIELN